jgi:hypothetical protein
LLGEHLLQPQRGDRLVGEQIVAAGVCAGVVRPPLLTDRRTVSLDKFFPQAEPAPSAGYASVSSGGVSNLVCRES